MIALYLFLHRQRCVAGAQRMVLMRHGRTEQRHDAVAQNLIDGPFIFVNRIHHDMQSRIDNVLGLFWIQRFDQFRGSSYIREKYRDLFPFAFQLVAGSYDFFSEVFGNVGIGRRHRGNRGRGCRCRFIDGLATISTELGPMPIWFTAIGASLFEPCATLIAECGIGRIFRLTTGTNHEVATI
jgi:hypothetical protein